MNWFKRNKTQTPTHLAQVDTDEKAPKTSFFSRMKSGLLKTKHQLGDGLERLFLGKKQIDAEVLETLETLLLSADLGVEVTDKLISKITSALERKELADGDAVFEALKTALTDILKTVEAPLNLAPLPAKPFVILTIGINGAGKTTTIGKLAKSFQAQGLQVMLAAGDTFRAAAIEQLERWGERNEISVIAQHTGADSASVVYDAYQAAIARGVDVLIADTAGRLHTQAHLMQELQKIKRVLQKINPAAPHETLLVLDASIGQNALNQAKQFHEAIGVTGIAMTKLDGTAKGGILFAIADALGLPFRYIGVGEGIDDLRPFESQAFVDAILTHDNIQPSH